MARKTLTPDDPDYWRLKGVESTAEFHAASQPNNIIAFNSIRKAFKGISRKIAGAFLSAARAGIKLGRTISAGFGGPGRNYQGVPVNPNLFPDGRQGRRFRWRIKIEFIPAAGGESLWRQVYVTSGKWLEPEVVKDKAEMLANLGDIRYPGKRSIVQTLEGFDAVYRIDSVFRSH